MTPDEVEKECSLRHSLNKFNEISDQIKEIRESLVHVSPADLPKEDDTGQIFALTKQVDFHDLWALCGAKDFRLFFIADIGDTLFLCNVFRSRKNIVPLWGVNVWTRVPDELMDQAKFYMFFGISVPSAVRKIKKNLNQRSLFKIQDSKQSDWETQI
jgi:hypothetical protein